MVKRAMQHTSAISSSSVSRSDTDKGQNLVVMVHFYPPISALLFGLVQYLHQKIITTARPNPQTFCTWRVAVITL
ncbi:unnamed protein product [Camellia sinensis]